MYFTMDSSFLPMVRLADETAIEPPYVHKKRVPGEWIVYLIKKGEMYLEENGVSYDLRTGDFLLLNPSLCHQGRRASRCEYFYIHFAHPDIHMVEADECRMREEMYKVRSAALKSDACCMSADSGSTGHTLLLPKYCHIADEAVYASVLQNLHDIRAANCDHMEYYKALCGCRFLQMLVQVSRSCLSAELERSGMVTARSYKKVLEVQNYLQSCYQEQITGDLLADRFDMNFDYLNRLFRKNVGKPIFQYLNSLRIAHARELLTTTSMRISQISERVGFMDESYFSKVFKKYTGVCPADYAKTYFYEKE